MTLFGLVNLLSSSCRSPRISGSAGVEEFSPKWLGSCWVVFSLPISEIVPLTYLLGGTTRMQAHLHPAVPSTDYSLLFLLLLKGPKRNLGFDHKQIILTWLLLL